VNISEAIKKRKSIRDFKPDPVSENVLREILETACRAPSAMNTQPWKFVVVTGKTLERVKRENIEKLRAGDRFDSEYWTIGWSSDSVYRQRQVALARQIFQLMDIEREDTKKRSQWMERGFRYFDAPSVILVLTDKALKESTPFLDIGAVMQNICLAALDYGLGTCIGDQGVMYPEVLRKHCGIPESDMIVISISVGHPNHGFPANRLESPREPLDTLTKWCTD